MKRLILFCVALGGVAGLAWWARPLWVRLMPITHEGTVLRIKEFRKGYGADRGNNTRQQSQFAILFADGFDCEGYDTSLAAVEPGDVIRIRAYHDVVGWPILNPEWWECDEAQLEAVVTPHP